MMYYLTQRVATPKGKSEIIKLNDKDAVFLIKGQKEHFSYRILDDLNIRRKVTHRTDELGP